MPKLAAENALLRQQLIILQRHSKKPWFTQTDRLWLVLLASRVRSWKEALLILKPDTLLRWHRQGFRLFWWFKSRNRDGRPLPNHRPPVGSCPLRFIPFFDSQHLGMGFRLPQAQQPHKATSFAPDPGSAFFDSRSREPVRRGFRLSPKVSSLEVLKTPDRVPQANQVWERFLGCVPGECLHPQLFVGGSASRSPGTRRPLQPYPAARVNSADKPCEDRIQVSPAMASPTCRASGP
jgi:hypothetical protein